jgi:protein-S-isoprenylcysteine O-methyltransferase Ste14
MFVLVRALTYATLFIGFVLVFLPARVPRAAGVVMPSTTGASQVLGLVLVITGAVLAVSCVLAFALLGRGTPAPFDPPRRLVVRGPYRFVRNPMYIGAALAVTGAAMFYRSSALATFALGFVLVMHVFVIAYEEPTLRRTFGVEYERYLDAVGRWWPTREHPR